jgi:hypothetical protein
LVVATTTDRRKKHALHQRNTLTHQEANYAGDHTGNPQVPPTLYNKPIRAFHHAPAVVQARVEDVSESGSSDDDGPLLVSNVQHGQASETPFLTVSHDGWFQLATPSQVYEGEAIPAFSSPPECSHASDTVPPRAESYMLRSAARTSTYHTPPPTEFIPVRIASSQHDMQDAISTSSTGSRPTTAVSRSKLSDYSGSDAGGPSVALPSVDALSEQYRSVSLAYEHEATIHQRQTKAQKRKRGNLRFSAVEATTQSEYNLEESTGPVLNLKSKVKAGSSSDQTVGGLPSPGLPATPHADCPTTCQTESTSSAYPPWISSDVPSAAVPETVDDQTSLHPSVSSASTALQHSRSQSSKLRLYSSLYVERARNPWAWHDNPNFGLELIRSFEEKDANGHTRSPVATGHTRQPLQGPSAISQSAPEPDHVPTFNGGVTTRFVHPPSEGRLVGNQISDPHTIEPEGGQDRSASPPMPFLTRPDSPQSRRQNWNRQDSTRVLMPQEGKLYCEKCKRHFENTWRLERHLSSSRCHPYYCQACTIDWPSFSALYNVRQPKYIAPTTHR